MMAGRDDKIIIAHLTSCVDFDKLNPFVKQVHEKLLEANFDFEQDKIELWIQKIDASEFKDSDKLGNRLVKACESNNSELLVFDQASSNERPDIHDFVNSPLVGSYVKDNSKTKPLFIR